MLPGWMARMDEVKKKILIVDDSELERVILRGFVDEKYDVIEACNAQEAYDILLSEGRNVVLATIDIFMPGKSGLELLADIRREPSLSELEVIVVTADNDVESAIKALDLGAADIITKPADPRVAARRIRNIATRWEVAALRRQVELDELTGIYNKRTFYKRTRALLTAYPHMKFTIVRWDLQNFKVINDLYGVLAGDRLLTYIGSGMKRRVEEFARRIGFSKELAVYGYMGADAFIACLPAEFANPEKIVSLVTADLEAYDIDIELVPYFGFYEIDEPSLDVEVMCDRALLAIRSVKGSYTSRYAYYTSEMRAALLAEQDISNEMEPALADGQFKVYVQPQYNYVTGEISGAEALVRWDHPKVGLISPGVFIPIFEKNGFITKMDEFVWEETCRLISEWRRDPRIKSVPPVSVNISRRDIYVENICGRLLNLVKKHGLPVSALNLEITESAYANDPRQLIETVECLRSMGFLIEMDDFGSGYSSLNSLKDVPVDILKLDLAFLRNSGDAKRGGNILSSVVRMARWLDLPVIAEGVETRRQAEFLRSLGCEYMQGYLFSRPLPAADFHELLTKSSVGTVRWLDESGQNWLDINELSDPTSHISAFFDRYMQGAAIFEYYNGRLEALRYNDEYFKVLGAERTKYDSVWRSVADRLLPDDRPAFTRALERAVAGGRTETCEIRSYPFQKDGAPLWIRMRISLVAHSGSRALLCISIADITAEKKNLRLLQAAKEENSRQNKLLRDLFAAHSEIYALDYGGGSASLMYSSRGQGQTAGDGSLTALLDNLVSHVHKNYRDQLRQFLSEDFQRDAGDGTVVSMEYPAMLDTLEARWYAVRMVQTGYRLFLLILTDITLQRKARPAFEKNLLFNDLRREQKRFSVIVDNMPVGIGIYRITDGKLRPLYMNDMNYRVFGYDRKNYDETAYPGVLRRIFADPQKIIDHLETIEIGHSVEDVVRACKKDGSVIWLRVICSAARDDDGGAVYYAALVDTTRTVEIEKKLSWQAERYRLMSESPSAITFDYDVENDVMTYSVFIPGKGREERSIANYLEYLPESRTISEDTKKIYGGALVASSYAPSEGSDEYKADYYGTGDYRWYRASYVSVADGDNGVYRVVGRVDDIQDEKDREHRLRVKAERDAVSGLLNRGTTEELVAAALAESDKTQSMMIVLDIDNFKSVNDVYGHPTGDAILKYVADAACGFCRPNDIVGRIGGDEFVIFLRGVRDVEAVFRRTQKFLNGVRDGSASYAAGCCVSVSAGMAAAEEGDRTFGDIFARADKALYEAKASGKNRCALYKG